MSLPCEVLQILDVLPLGVLVLSEDMSVQYWNRILVEWTGHAADQVVGRPVSDILPSLASSRYTGRIKQIFEGGPPVLFSPQLHPHLIPCGRAGGVKCIQQTTVTSLTHAGIVYAVVSVQDVTDLMLTARESRQLHQQALQEIAQREQAEVALQASAERVRAIVENTVEAIIVINQDGLIEEFNPAAVRIFGYQAAEVIGSNVKLLMPEPYRSEHDRYLEGHRKDGVSHIIGVGGDVTGRKKDGSTFPLHLSIGRMNIGGRLLFTGVLHDITAQKQLEEHLRTLSMRDGLTGINNRRSFDDTLEREWRRALRKQECLSLILMDIDFFKRYNDTYGHQDGDACLKAVTQALSGAVHRPGDLVARYGGEEFVILLPATPVAEAMRIAERIRLAVAGLAIPNSASEVASHVTVSLGVAGLVPLKEQDCATPVRHADLALYAAKAGGRNRVEVHQA